MAGTDRDLDAWMRGSEALQEGREQVGADSRRGRDDKLSSAIASLPSFTAWVARSANGRKARPASVSRIPCRVRTNSFSPSSLSSAWRRAVRVGWLT
jgi:hypothetical protein